MRCKETRRSPASLWAYLSDPMPTQGPQRLIEQKRIVDALAATTARRIDRHIIDSGGALSAEGKSARLGAAITAARTSNRDITLVIASVSYLAATRDARRGILADLLAAGIAVEDPSGSLHPTVATVTLAKAATRSRTDRRNAAARSSIIDVQMC